MGIFDGVHTGVVDRTKRGDRRGIPFGYIKDDDPSVGELFFRNFGGEFEAGDVVAYRTVPATPNPVAYGLIRKDEIDRILDVQAGVRL